MNRFFLGWVLAVLLLPSPVWAVEAAPALTDREIAERLTRLETRLDEGLQGLRADIQQLRADMGPAESAAAGRHGPATGGHEPAESAAA